MYDLIEKKRNGEELTRDEIHFMIENYTNGNIPDYQMSAFLMAVYFQGMTEVESAELTKAMIDTGETIDLSNIKGIKVDKHSTGGVGDKTTLLLGPLAASVGVYVPKMSGRGLGHTGGTIDKLESIPGFHVELSKEQFVSLVNENHLAIIGQSQELVPADKKLYSLRDVTATVNSTPLIASSIMSKKIASGADRIVLDVKVGTGAFMKHLDDARQLAKNMVAIGKNVDRKTVAIISNMDQPLGHAVGNALEIKEVIDTFKGVGPKDLTELTLELGSHMVVLAEKAHTKEEARNKLEQNLHNGKALDVFKRFVKAQGGNEAIVDEPELLPKAAYTIDVNAEKDGFVSTLVADEIGKAAMLLGAGREKKEDKIDYAVGVVIHKKLGDAVEKGERIFTIHANETEVKKVKEMLSKSVEITDKKITPPIILDTIE